MKTRGTSEFVREIVTAWLKEIRDPAILDTFEVLIKQRRTTLAIETEDEIADKIIAALPRCKYGDVLHLMHPLPKPKWIATQRSSKLVKYELAENRMKCKFYAWQPRKKMLWVSVPWKTSRDSDGTNLIMLKVPNIKKFQPSRTEREVRILQQQRRS